MGLQRRDHYSPSALLFVHVFLVERQEQELHLCIGSIDSNGKFGNKNVNGSVASTLCEIE